MSTAQAQNKPLFLPDIGDLIFVLVLYLLLRLRPDMIFDDGSTGWHLVTGNYIWQHHCVPYTDILSFTFVDKSWVAFEWLTDFLMAGLVKLGGLHLLVVVVTALIALMFNLLYRSCRNVGCNFIFASILTVCSGLLTSIHWLARPHILTFFGVYIFARLLDNYYSDKISAKKLAIWLCLITLIWTNCHPGYLIGLGLIAVYCLVTFIEFLCLNKNDPSIQIRELRGKQSLALLTIFLIASATTLINPYGFGLYAYIGHHIFYNQIKEVTDEFLSPVFHGDFQPALLESLFAMFTIGLCIVADSSRKKLKLPDLIIFLIFAHMALTAKRHMPLFAIVATPIIARLYTNTNFSPNGGKLFPQLTHWLQNIITKLCDLNARFTPIERRCSYHLLPIITFLLLVLVAFYNGTAFGITVIDDRFPAKRIPEGTLTAIKQLKLDPKHGLAMDNWGGILSYRLNYPVFIDDRSDFYGEPFFDEYGVLISTFPGWQKLMAKYQITWVLMPPNNRLIDTLRSDNNWKLAAADKASVLMVKKLPN